jgi:fructose-1,6-bisphosphatase I
MMTFETYLESHRGGALNDDLVAVLREIAAATRQISDKLRTSSLAGLTGATEVTNVQGETQKPLDVIRKSWIRKSSFMPPANTRSFSIRSTVPPISTSMSRSGRSFR